MNIQSTFALSIILLALNACTQADSVDSQTDHSQHHDAEDHPMHMVSAKVAAACTGFGPQTPRDIDNRAGNNKVAFPLAPASDTMNLCNIHFHNGAEHKAKAFSVKRVLDDAAQGPGGYQCGISQSLSAAERAPFARNACAGVAPGDTIEVHWVHSTCDVDPGPGLGSCLSEQCANPSLRVETQVFTVVNDPSAMDFGRLTSTSERNGYQQAVAIPSDTGTPVQFGGSTTGPKYTEAACSPLQVTWSVRPSCAKVDIASLSAWCEDNVFDEDHAHGVRQLVVDPDLLSPIR